MRRCSHIAAGVATVVAAIASAKEELTAATGPGSRGRKFESCQPDRRVKGVPAAGSGASRAEHQPFASYRDVLAVPTGLSPTPQKVPAMPFREMNGQRLNTANL